MTTEAAVPVMEEGAMDDPRVMKGNFWTLYETREMGFFFCEEEDRENRAKCPHITYLRLLIPSFQKSKLEM